MPVMTTARFAQVVAKAGRPVAHLLWSDPAQDPAVQRALRAHRVMTIHLEMRGAKTAFGHVGVPEGGEKSQLLIFPRSIKAYSGARVVGINFDLIDEGESLGSPLKDPA